MRACLLVVHFHITDLSSVSCWGEVPTSGSCPPVPPRLRAVSPVCRAAAQHLRCGLPASGRWDKVQCEVQERCRALRRSAGCCLTETCPRRRMGLEVRLRRASPSVRLLPTLPWRDLMQRAARTGRGTNGEMSVQDCRIADILKDTKAHKGCWTLRTKCSM